jgi:integrase/recombinase XerC
MIGNIVPAPLLPVSRSASIRLPAIISDAGAKASEHFLEFFAVTIRNPNTRAAYVQAAAQFLRWCEQYEAVAGGIS